MGAFATLHVAHAEAEEKFVYPVLRRKDAIDEHEAEHGQEEHAEETRRSWSVLELKGTDTQSFDDAVEEADGLVNHHLTEESRRSSTSAREEVSEKARAELGEPAPSGTGRSTPTAAGSRTSARSSPGPRAGPPRRRGGRGGLRAPPRLNGRRRSASEPRATGVRLLHPLRGDQVLVAGGAIGASSTSPRSRARAASTGCRRPAAARSRSPRGRPAARAARKEVQVARLHLVERHRHDLCSAWLQASRATSDLVGAVGQVDEPGAVEPPGARCRPR